MNFIIFLALLLALFYGDILAAEDSPCGTWLPYKDEKCYWIVDDTLRTFAEAVSACEALDDTNSPTLVKIHTKEEQDFLSNYLFKTSKKLESFWIGAKVDKNGHNSWIDQSVMSYANWDVKGPRNKSDYCVEIQADESVMGKWLDEPCGKKNLVVCQRVQSWSMARLTQTLLDAKRAIDEANRQIVVLKQSSIPLGFIYTQLPSQQSPAEIWPSMGWTDISATYAGIFWRVVGGDAEKFGTTQAEHAPALVQIERGQELDDHSGIQLNQTSTFIKVSATEVKNLKQSEWLFAGDLSNSWSDIQYNNYLRFITSTGEVRPRNMAIKVWKRTA